MQANHGSPLFAMQLFLICTKTNNQETHFCVCPRNMLSDLGVALVTISGTLIVCIVPFLYCIQRCSKRIMIVPDPQKVHVQIESSINVDDENEEKCENG